MVFTQYLQDFTIYKKITLYVHDLFHDNREGQGKDQTLRENQTDLVKNLNNIGFHGTLGTSFLQLWQLLQDLYEASMVDSGHLIV